MILAMLTPMVETELMSSDIICFCRGDIVRGLAIISNSGTSEFAGGSAEERWNIVAQAASAPKTTRNVRFRPRGDFTILHVARSISVTATREMKEQAREIDTPRACLGTGRYLPDFSASIWSQTPWTVKVSPDLQAS